MALMKLKCLEGVEIDPETCPIEELERIKDSCKREEDYWNTMQLSAKTFINSVYGVFGTSYFNLANIDIAESITLQGQDLIKYSVIKVDDYFKNMWHLDYEGHKRVSDIMINEYGFKDFDRENFERMARTPLQFNTLQVYGDTDSCSFDSQIVTKLHPDGITIKNFYEENINNTVEVGDRKESVTTDDMVLNYSGNEIYLAPISRIIRHKVTKDKYLLVAKYSGKNIECTSDHSLIVYRKEDDTGQYWSHIIKPYEMKEGDLVVTCENNSYTFEEATCEKIGKYNNEYVYDIEMDDLTSTFVANGILVHNSAYLTMEPLLNLYGIPDDQMVKFCLAVYKAVMEKYLDDKFDEYAAHFHCKENLEKFELEKVSRAVIMLAKKNYMCDVAWIDSGVFFEQGHHVTYTGYDVVKGATTNFCREEMKNFTNFCFQKIHEGRIPTQGECVQLLRGMKQRFAMQSPNEIGKTVSISEYEKFVKADNKPQIEYFNYSSATVMEASPSSDKVVFASVPGNWKKDDIVSFYTNIGGQVSKISTLKIAAIHGNTVTFSSLYANIPNGCEAINENRKTPVPIHVRAAAVYNNTILVKNRKYLSKYELLKSGDKIRFYYTSEDEVFGFIPDNFPYEFAPPVDVDVQFDKSLLSPINRIIVALGLNEVPPSLTYSVGLF